MKLRCAIPVLAMTLLLAGQAQAFARSVTGVPTAAYSGMSWFLVAFELGPWDEYLIHELTPDLERLTTGHTPHVTWMHLDEGLIVPDFGLALLRQTRTPLTFTWQQRSSALTATAGRNRLAGGQMRFEQSVVMPGISHQMTDRSALTVSAVLATQVFGTGELNLTDSGMLVGNHHGRTTQPYGQPEVAHGAGVRFAFSNDLMPWVTVEAAYQSRIEMAEFTSMQGLHGTRAEFDIPSRIQLGMQLHATDRTSLNLGVAQVFYSEVGAFPSRALPARFNALLGDSTSPEFSWDDLLVYSIGWRWTNDSDLSLFFDYRTRTQPKPSSSVLAASLAPELAQHAFLAGLSKDLGERTRFQLSAAYAPPEFAFGGNVMGVVSDKLDQSVEVQAMVKFDF